MQRVIEQKQMKDFMRLYTGLVERCFDDCVNDFTSKAPTSKEQACIANCTQKFLKHSERVGARFGEEKYVERPHTALGSCSSNSRRWIPLCITVNYNGRGREVRWGGIALEPKCRRHYLNLAVRRACTDEQHVFVHQHGRADFMRAIVRRARRDMADREFS